MFQDYTYVILAFQTPSYQYRVLYMFSSNETCQKIRCMIVVLDLFGSHVYVRMWSENENASVFLPAASTSEQLGLIQDRKSYQLASI